MMTHAEYLAAYPLPVCGVIFARMAPPQGFEPKLCVRKHRLDDGPDVRHYTPRATDAVTKRDFRAKYLGALSKTRWRTSAEIAAELDVSVVSVNKVMARDYMLPLILRRKQKCSGGLRWEWRLKK